MLIHFWGVRGSLPSPARPESVREKINAVFMNALPEDFVDEESKRRFLDGLPPWLYGTVGGNTPCVSIAIDGFNEPLIFDTGSGARELGIAYNGTEPRPQKYHVFYSHFHWDHLQGLPFFNPAYDPQAAVDFYSPQPGVEEYLCGQMRRPYFPAVLENMAAKKNFHLLTENVTIGPAEISFKKMNHPGDSFSFQVRNDGKRFIYATDTELSASDFSPTDENKNYFTNADLIILDSQYTPPEAELKYHWGHSAFNMSVDFAVNWSIKHLVLFHHDPAYDDDKLYGILQSARRRLDEKHIKGLEISLAVEGLEIRL